MSLVFSRSRIPQNYVPPAMDSLAPQCSIDKEKSFRHEQDELYALLKVWNKALETANLTPSVNNNKLLLELIRRTRAWFPSNMNSAFLSKFELAIAPEYEILVLENYVEKHLSDLRLPTRPLEMPNGLALLRFNQYERRVYTVAYYLYQCTSRLYEYLKKKNEQHLQALAEEAKADADMNHRYSYLEDLKKKTKNTLCTRAVELRDSNETINEGERQLGHPRAKEDELYLIALNFFSNTPTPLFSILFTRAQVDYVFHGHCGDREHQTDIQKLLYAHLPEKIESNSSISKDSKAKSPSSPLLDAILIFLLMSLAIGVLALLFYVNTVKQP